MALHDASTIAAVIVEPIAGSTGVLVPPKGYLQKLREMCTKHGILLIFDEVITGFGRTGSAFGAQEFGVTPDIITCAKGLTNGCVPMGAVIVKKEIYDAFMTGTARRHRAVPRLHVFRHPTACAAGLATLDIYERDGLFQRAKDTRALLGARRAQPAGPAGRHRRPQLRPGSRPGVRAAHRCTGSARVRGLPQVLRAGVLVRTTGDTIALSPPLIIEKFHIDELFGTLAEVIRTVA